MSARISSVLQLTLSSKQKSLWCNRAFSLWFTPEWKQNTDGMAEMDHQYRTISTVCGSDLILAWEPLSKYLKKQTIFAQNVSKTVVELHEKGMTSNEWRNQNQSNYSGGLMWWMDRYLKATYAWWPMASASGIGDCGFAFHLAYIWVDVASDSGCVYAVIVVQRWQLQLKKMSNICCC